MKNLSFAFGFIFASITACSPAHQFNKDKPAFEASAVTESFRAVSDLNDSYFDIRENNFFEFYRQLFDSVKNTRYPGKYSLQGDTMLLKFYDKKGYEMLARKAYIDRQKKEIVFFDKYPGIRKRLLFN